MLIRPGDRKRYPKFARYVSTELPEIARVPSIIAAIERFAGSTPRKTIQDALLPGKLPRVEVATMKSTSTQGGALVPMGGYRAGSNVIQIAEIAVLEHEAGKGLRRTASGHLVVRVGVILLHELTHWANEQDGVDEHPDLEEGFEFEKTVYGGVVE